MSNLSKHSDKQKQYLIDSINEMNAFIDKCLDKLNNERDEISETAYKAITGVINRKKDNIRYFKQLLQSQYNHKL